jgi:hypothetical protein
MKAMSACAANDNSWRFCPAHFRRSPRCSGIRGGRKRLVLGAQNTLQKIDQKLRLTMGHEAAKPGYQFPHPIKSNGNSQCDPNAVPLNLPFLDCLKCHHENDCAGKKSHKNQHKAHCENGLSRQAKATANDSAVITGDELPDENRLQRICVSVALLNLKSVSNHVTDRGLWFPARPQTGKTRAVNRIRKASAAFAWREGREKLQLAISDGHGVGDGLNLANRQKLAEFLGDDVRWWSYLKTLMPNSSSNFPFR